MLRSARLSLEREISLHVSSFCTRNVFGCRVNPSSGTKCLNFATNLPLNLLLLPNYLLYTLWWLPRKPLQHLNLLRSFIRLAYSPFRKHKQEDKLRNMLNKNTYIAEPNELYDFEHVPAYPRVSVWRAVCLLPEFTLACVHYSMQWRARGGVVGWGTALQAGRSRIRFPMVPMEFFIDIIFTAALWLWGRFRH